MEHKVIDTHAHLWPNGYLDALKQQGSNDTDVARDIGADDSNESIKKRIKMMDEAGVKFQILSATPQSPQWGDEATCVKLAQQINNRYAEIMEQYPGRFKAYAAVPLPYVEASIEEAKRAITELGFYGVAVNTLIKNEIPMGDEKFDAFYDAINQLETVLYIHPTGCGAHSFLVNDYHLEWVIGAPIEDMILPLIVLKKDLPNRYPQIKFHIAHLGGGLPFLMQRIEDNYEDWNAFTSSPTKMLKEHFWFDAANFHQPSLISSVETFGVSRILMGSDFPYLQNDKYLRAVRYIENSSLPEEEIADILYNNAQDLYGIDESSKK